MPDPYIVGRWVRRSDHYARHTLIEQLLLAQDAAYWLVGTRRMGKTSLLRQIEHLANQPENDWVPLFWDLQGCMSPEDLTRELVFTLEDEADRFVDFGLEIDQLADRDANEILRRISRALRRSDKRLLLLIDEAEVLVNIAEVDDAWLARMRRALQEGNQRTILASTKLLTQLTDQSMEWMTSPFLFGFQLTHLWPFNREGARNLVLQTQSDTTVHATESVINEILAYTNHHPYLIQYLCQRLYVVDAENGTDEETGDVRESGRLRAVEERDLAIDHMLDAYFRVDFEHLSQLEQRVMLIVAQSNTVTTDQIGIVAGAHSSSHLRRVLGVLTELGQLRSNQDSWMIGNEFLRRWLHDHEHDLRIRLEDEQIETLRIAESEVVTMAETLGTPRWAPVSLMPEQADDAQEFFHAVQSFFYAIRHFVEQDDGHKLLVNSVSGNKILRSEEEIQIALKHWLRPMCRELDIDLNREPLTGRGYLDFKFSVGHRYRCLVEVKLFNSSKLHDGVSIQLPLYLMADQAHLGIYIPVFLEQDGHDETIVELQQLAAERAQSHGFNIEVIDIRAFKPKSASKAAGVELFDRYSPKATS